MWGGSYAGYDQWATAQKFPPHLATIVPVSSVVPGVDFPVRNNTFPPYDIQGCTMTLHLVRSTITGATWRKLHRQRARHFLVIGPWDHPGTRTPKQEFMGMTFGAASLVDLPKLHLDWSRFTMEGGSKPEFLQKQVAYYLSGAEHWRYADTLEAITQSQDPSSLIQSVTVPAKWYAAGYDPRDLSLAKIESESDLGPALDDSALYQAVFLPISPNSSMCLCRSSRIKN